MLLKYIKNTIEIIKVRTNKATRFYDEEKSKIKEIELLLEGQYEINTVKDEDGYVNLRKGNSLSSAVVDKINNGDKIEIIDNVGKWWLVQTKAGKQGYVFSAKVTHN